jgi:hypothetical protein
MQRRWAKLAKMPNQTLKAESVWQPRVAVVEHLATRLWSYLNSAAIPSERESILLGLTRLPPSDFARLVDQRLAARPEVEDFINRTTPSILRSIAKSTETEPQTGWGRIRGRIDWQLTTAAQRESGGFAGRYVWRSAERVYDLPENRLFKFGLRTVRALARRAASGTKPSTEGIGTWRDKSARIALTAERDLGHIALRNVMSVPTLDVRCWQRSWNHRRADYRSAASFLSWFEAARLRGSLENWRLLASTYLVPLSNDSVFELYVLMKAIQAAEAQEWTVVEVRAIGALSAPVFRLARPGATCDIYYQHTPAILKERSNYIAMFRDTGISTTVRRPDIVVRIDGSRGVWLGLVEVKRTSSPSYISDGIYKCLGYLRDFAEIDAQLGPKAVMVVWGGIKATFQPDSEVSVLTANALSKGLQPFLSAALESVS